MSTLAPTYGLQFERILHPGSGFIFPCDKAGNLLDDQMTASMRRAYLDCVGRGRSDFRGPDVITYPNGDGPGARHSRRDLQ